MRLFREALLYVLKNEGEGFVDDPDDSGGPTKFGVSERMYTRFTGRNVERDEIRNLTIEEATLFFETMYWNENCLQLTDPRIATAIFDCSILYGTRRAARLSQQAVCLTGLFIEADGIIGRETVKALNLEIEVSKFLVELKSVILNEIELIILEFPEKEKYRRGWTARAERVLTLVNRRFLVN